MRARSLSLALATVALLGSAARADDAAPVPTTPKEAVKTVEIARGPFVVNLELPGVFHAVGHAEVAYEPKLFDPNAVYEVVEAFRGGPVEKDQVLVRFSTEKIDEHVDVTARDVEIASRVLDRQREESKRAKEASDAALREAALERERADRELRRFPASERAIRTRESELGLKGAEDSITDNEEELEQLKKMYKGGDALEETEEIVLRRHQRHLDRLRIGLEFRKTRHRWFVDVDLPDEQKRLELIATKETLQFERAKATADVSLEQGRLELARAEANLARAKKTLADLREDRAALVLKAPRAGLAVPGSFSRGKWHNVDDISQELRKDGRLRARTVLFTIVEPGAVALRAVVAEGKVLAVKPGQTAEVKPAADEAKAVGARVVSIAPAAGEGGFAVHLDLDDRDARFLPGFTAKVKVAVRHVPDAIVLPVGAVGADGERRIVHVVAGDATTPREVKLGETSDGKVEILEGLKPGEKVLEAAPK